MLERTRVDAGRPARRIEEMDFRPGKLFPALMCVFVTAIFGTFGAIFAVNIYRELRAPTTALDTWGWIVGGALTYGLALLLLHVVTTPWRISFAEDGVRVRNLFGRRFVAWSRVRAASILPSKSGLILMLSTGRLGGVNIPLGSYRRRAALASEVRKRLPCAIQDPRGLASQLTDD